MEALLLGDSPNVSVALTDTERRGESRSLRSLKDDIGDSKAGGDGHGASRRDVCERLASVVDFMSTLISSSSLAVVLSMGSMTGICHILMRQRPNSAPYTE